MSYQQLSGSDLPAGIRTDVDRQGPAGLPQSAFGTSNAHTAEVIHERPTSIVILPKADSATFAFLYKTTGSIGDAAGVGHGEYVTGSKIMADGASLSLPIQPVAWRRTDAASVTGDITFVYRGGL